MTVEAEHGLKLRPFFIVGSPRSGTTLLRFMLSSHPNLYVPDETGFVPFLSPWMKRALSPQEVQACLQRIGRLNRFWSNQNMDLQCFYGQLAWPDLAHLLDALYKQRFPGQSAVRWGDKTPLYVRFVGTIRRIFPAAQFVHLIRDGRDASLSARAKWAGDNPYMDLYYLMRHWERNVAAGLAAQKRLGDQHMITLRYERLVAEPEESLIALCNFLGESFDTRMLDFSPLARQEGGGVDALVEAQEPLHQSSVGRWQEEMTPFEKKLAGRLIGKRLRELEYADTRSGRWTPTDRVRIVSMASKFALADTTRTLLYKSGLLTLNRNRRQRA